MTDNIVQFTGNTKVDQPPEVTLEQAKGWGMTKCMVLGFDEDNELHFGGSFSDAGEMILMLEEAKRRVLSTVFP